ncbi:hypothetical protein GG851_22800 [Bordetella petrii]|nr:hypothetical protein [Bordetella petrii]
MSASSVTLPNRDGAAGAGPAHRPLSAIAAAASGGVPQARIRRVLADVAGQLAEVHAQGRAHGAVALSTVGLDSTGQAHLLVPPLMPAADAEGAARFEGYAAFEQYTDDPDKPCGPWTDAYALSAVAHALVVGAAPPGALARCVKDTYAPLAGRDLGAYDPEFLQAVDRGLSMTHTARPADMAAFAQVFGLAAATPPAAEPVPAAAAPQPELPPVAPAAKPAPGPRVPLLVLLGVLAAVAFAVYLWLRPGAPGSQATRPEPPPPAPPPAAQPQAPVPTPPALSELGAPRAASPASPAPAGPQAPDGGAVGEAAPTPAAPAAPTAPDLSNGAAPVPAVPPAEPAPAPEGGATPPDGPDAAAGAPAEAGAAAGPGAAADAAPADAATDGQAAGVAATAGDPAAAGDAPAAAAPPEAQATEPAAEAPPAAVAVRVHVRPWGEVFVDDRSRGISPPLSQLTLSPGRHRVTIRNPAAPDFHTTVNVSAGGSASISHVFE